MTTDDKTVKPGGGIGRRQFTGAAIAGAATLPVLHPLRLVRAQAPVRVGVLLPRSGFLSAIGAACWRGAELAPNILSDMGLAVEVIGADTESNPDTGRIQAERLIREGVDILVGCFDSGTTAAVAQVAEQNGMPFVINIAADPAITEQGYQYVFRNFPKAPTLVMRGLGSINNLFEVTGTTPQTTVFMHVNDTFGTAMSRGIQALAPQVGVPYEFVDSISYDPQARDLSVEVARARALEPDFLMVVTRLNDAILLVRECVRQRFDTMGIISPGSPGMYEKQFAETLGPYAEYATTSVPWFNPTSPITTELQSQFVAEFPDQTFELNPGFTFEALMICADAAQRAGSNNTDDLVAALRATEIAEHPMYGGPIQFDEEGQNPNIGTVVVQIQDGNPVVTAPVDIATNDPVFPVPSWSDRG